MMCPPGQRSSAAEHVRAIAGIVAEEVTDRFLSLHPDWTARYGARARVLGIEDARYHLSFLAAAVESGTPAAFADYARWTARVLESRGIAQQFLAENLGQVRDAVSVRLPPELSRAVHECVSAALQALADEAPAEPAVTADERLSLARGMYLQAVLAGERRAALNIATEALRGGTSPVDVYIEILQGSLYEVGRLWETNRITVAHEHAATAITQFVMAHLYACLERVGTVAPRGSLLMTGVEGDLHSVGPLMVADVLETCGWVVHFLGSNLPQKAILDAVEEHQPDCIGISATMLFSLAEVRRLVDAIRDQSGPARRIIVGGAAFRHAPALWQELGADGHAGDLRAAVSLLCP